MRNGGYGTMCLYPPYKTIWVHLSSVLCPLFSASHREKIAEHRTALLRQHPAGHLGVMVQTQPLPNLQPLPSPPLVRGGSWRSSPDKGRPGGVGGSGGVELSKRIHHAAARSRLRIARPIHEPRDT